MLIKALCDYYDLLAVEGKTLPDGYSNVRIHYLVCLTADGRIDAIIDCQETVEIPAEKGKVKEKKVPIKVIMPKRKRKTAINSYVIEHRSMYLFGLEYDSKNQILRTTSENDKARKSHKAFCETNMAFIEGLDSPVVNAYRNFLQNWDPERETDNSALLDLGKNYQESNFAFCLTGYPDKLLHDDCQVKQKWDKIYGSMEDKSVCHSQCSISGEVEPISRLHDAIDGISGGKSSGSFLVTYNNDSEESYGKKQSYNSNVSEKAMQKYTEMLNFLLDPYSVEHRIVLDDVTVVFWAMNTNGAYEDIFTTMLYGQPDEMDAAETEHMLKDLLQSGKKGAITENRLQSLHKIKENVDFYMLGLKPNDSRLSVKFIYRKKYLDVLWNIARFQKDMQISEKWRQVPFWKIKDELRPHKSDSKHKSDSNEVKVNPALLTKLFEAALYGTLYPAALLEIVVRRIKSDQDERDKNHKLIWNRINDTRAGIIKASLNRNYKKEEFDVSLNKENKEPAYLCGRLFSVLEKLQQAASETELNRTIKDSYFASAASNPSIIFPKLLKLAQHHLNCLKMKSSDSTASYKKPEYYDRLIEEIIDKIEGEFPGTLLLQDQGRFMIGYYQQYHSFFEKNRNTEADSIEDNKMEEN